jgi:hypothetical protein
MKRNGRMMRRSTTPDVTEAQRAHHGECPVDPREPRVLLTLPRHDHVEQPAVEEDDGDEEGEVPDERREPLLQRAAPRHQRSQMGADGLHAEMIIRDPQPATP